MFLSFSNSESRCSRWSWRPLWDELWFVVVTSPTSAVHVAGHYRVQVPGLEVQQKASFRAVSLQGHQGVKNDLHRETQRFKLHICPDPSRQLGRSPGGERRGPPTWLRCSMELDSLPVFSSRGMVLSSWILGFCPSRGLWIRTRAVTSIFPFNPNLGDQTFSSMSTSSATVIRAAGSWHLPGALLL